MVSNGEAPFCNADFRTYLNDRNPHYEDRRDRMSADPH